MLKKFEFVANTHFLEQGDVRILLEYDRENLVSKTFTGLNGFKTS